MLYPTNSGYANVTSYGATGNGTTDDTSALQSAISAVAGSHRMLYFPNGTYLISDELVSKLSNGTLIARLYLVGQSKTGVILKLQNNCSGFTNASTPKAMLRFNSDNADSSGSGNQAFGNSIVDMTIDVGSGNSGAIAVKYIANNFGKIQNVAIKSSDTNKVGAIALSLERYGQGPCLFSNLSIDGFETQIDSHHYDYGLTFENLTLTNPRSQGIYSGNGNPLFIRNLVFTTSSGKPFGRFQDDSYVCVLTGTITNTGTSATYAIQANDVAGDKAHFFLRNVSVSGFTNAINLRGTNVVSLGSEYSSLGYQEIGASSQKSLNLPVKETPNYISESFYTDFSQWQAVATPNGTDDGSAIASAMNSGKPVIYFPYGAYKITSTINVPSTVRWIVGMNSFLFINVGNAGGYFNDASNPKPIWTVANGTNSLIIENFVAAIFTQDTGLAGGDVLHNSSSRSICLKASDYARGEYKNNVGSPTAPLGELYVEDVAMGARFDRPQSAWLRQFNNEKAALLKTTNNGGTVWIFGYKTENNGTMMKTTNGGATEVFGYFHNFEQPTVPAVEDVDSFCFYVLLSGGNYHHDPVWSQTRKGATQTKSYASLFNFGHRFILTGSSTPKNMAFCLDTSLLTATRTYTLPDENVTLGGSGSSNRVYSTTAPSTNKLWIETNAAGAAKYPFAWVYEDATSSWISEEVPLDLSLNGALEYRTCGLDSARIRRITGYNLSAYCGLSVSKVSLFANVFSDNSAINVLDLTLTQSGDKWQTFTFNDYASSSYVLSANTMLSLRTFNNSSSLTTGYVAGTIKYRIVR